MTASASAVGPPPGMRVRLSSNESPFGPSPRALEAARLALITGHRYPDDQSVALRTAIAAHEGAEVANVAVGTGSAALLMDITAAYAPGGSVLAFDKSFIVYRLGAANVAATYIEVPCGPGPSDPSSQAGRTGYQRDVDVLLDRIQTDTKIVAIDNPGNPTGMYLPADGLARLIGRIPEHITVIVDEAYHQFADGHRGYQTVHDARIEHPRLLVLRTFSKAYALAGLRIGYLVGPRELVAEVDARRTRFNVTAPAQAAAEAALADVDHLQNTVEQTVAGRREVVTALQQMGVAAADGLGNFVTIELGTAADPVVAAFAERGVGVRELHPYGMHEQIRVTIGTSEENTAFLDVAGDILAP